MAERIEFMKNINIDFSKLPPLELEMPHLFTEADEALKGKSVLHKGISVKTELAEVLRNLLLIPAHEYEIWRNVCYVLKNEGFEAGLFYAWSATADNYDEDACRKLWRDTTVRDDGLRMGTLVHMAQQSCQSSPEMLPAPSSDDANELFLQFYSYLVSNYPENSWVEIVYRSFEKKGKHIPARNQAEYLAVPLQDQDIINVFFHALENNAAGVWGSLNPVCSPENLKGKATSDDDVIDFRYALVECDSMTKEAQWEFLHRYHLPIQSVVWSGGKSLHAVVKIDAGNDKELYKTRVNALFTYLEYLGMPIDKANRNPGRLTRLPGFKRNNDLQYCVAEEMGPANWQNFIPYLDLVLDNIESEKKKLQSESKHMDARALTSPVNGQKGGRPEMPVTDFARDFFYANKNA